MANLAQTLSVTIADVRQARGTPPGGEVVFSVVVDGPAGFQTMPMTREEVRTLGVMQAFFAHDAVVLPPSVWMRNLEE